MAAAPASSSSCAAASPSASALTAGPLRVVWTMRVPSGDATSARSDREPPSLRDTARSASTQDVVAELISGASQARMSSRSSRISMPSAPCPAAGRLSAGSSRLLMRPPSPRRSSPAAARTMASYSPLSSLPRRVARLPRSGLTTKAG
ncbi:hypothetical protein G6F24_015799 [Rhizopus arrhizus]|nr:hypothetical protein G6F24_015799 [Rhizopus arrhizus]